MKFTFKSKFHGFGSPETTMEFEADALEDVLMYFEQFLSGAGYHFDGRLDFVSEDSDENYYTDDDIFVEDQYDNYEVNFDALQQNFTVDKVGASEK